MYIRSLLFFIPVLGWLFISSCNPFAPAYDPEGLKNRDLLGDPRTLDGYFLLFKNSYEFRDTLLYGRLFTQDFLFTYYDPDLGQEIQWDRATELNTSYNMFQAVQMIALDWNFYTQVDTTETEAVVVRNFNLRIEESPSVVYSGTGRARLRLRREMPGSPWRAYYWFDDSDF